MKRKTINIFPSTYLYIAWWVMIFVFIFSFILFGYLAKQQNELIPIVIIIYIISFIGLLIVLLSKDFRQWITKFCITKDKIEIRIFYKLKKTIKYTEYNQINYGFMVIRGVPEWFIIISNRKMGRYELSHLNKIQLSDDFIKIKYSKKRRMQLQEILPENMTYLLKNPPPGKK